MSTKKNINRPMGRPISRRRFVAGGLTAAAVGAAALSGASCSRDQIYAADYPRVPENQVSLEPNGKSVLILGGGFGGMHAACELVDRGFKVTIVEKTNILGGKLKSWRDKQFGVPPTDDPGWTGYPRDHGLHAVWGSYNNLREFMGRHGYNLWKFSSESTIYNYVGRDGLNFQLGRKPTWPGYLGRLQGLWQTNRELGKIVGPDLDRMRGALLKMAAFDFDDNEQRTYLDGISFPEWARSVGMPESAIQKLFGSNARMSMMDNIENASALAILGLSSTVSGHPDDMRVDTFMHPAGETYIAPLERYIKDRGGAILYNTPVVRVNREGGRIKSVTAGDENGPVSVGTKIWKCNVCGTVYFSPTRPARCSVCGAESAQLIPADARPAREYVADYYILALDLPGAQQVISSSGLGGQAYFDRIMKLPATAVYPVNIWYADCDSWQNRFPRHADFFPSEFKYLGITINLAHNGEIEGEKVVEPLVPEYQNRKICVIETQVPDAGRVARMTDDMIASLVHEELKIVMPDLPTPTDFYVNRWDNYSPQRVGNEALRPPIQSPIENLFLIGDWVKTDHLSVYMEKTCVAAKMATNCLVDRVGRSEGRMTILRSGTPSAIIAACRTLYSIYP
jgi:uncharacterized protein with NAD-binding domain and iron-sulfur cluster